MTSLDDFEYVNENSIHEDLLCPLCTDPFEEPVCAKQCGHTFCRNCITTTFQTMNRCPTCREILKLEDFHPINIRPFLNHLNQLLVTCKFCSITNIQRGNFDDHRKQCTNREIPCPAANIDCNWKGKRDQLEEHTRACALVKIQPKINELTRLVERQSEQIKFLFTVLQKLSVSKKQHWRENYGRGGSAQCDICNGDIQFSSRLHFCPNTDICHRCIGKHFSS